MAFSNCSDALKQLLMAREYGGTITRSADKIITALDGLSYYFVEIMFPDSGYYVIEARGDEAVELYREVRKLKEEKMILVIIEHPTRLS